MTTTDTKTTYSEKLLSARMLSVFITIPQTTIDYVELHNLVKTYKQTSYVLTKLEQHKDKGLHIHQVIKFKQQVRIGTIHNIITSLNGTIGGMIDYDKPKVLTASIIYLKKEETSIADKPYLEDGDTPNNHGRFTDDTITGLLDAITLAQEGDLDKALEQVKQIDPMKYLVNKQQIKETLQQENKTRIKYDLPSFKSDSVKLNAKQQQVWDLLQETPKPRRIIWVSGSYGSGKSFLFNYITSNHTHSVYNAGSSASMDNVIYGYDEEGVVAWDLPRTFDFETLGNSIASVIEKFSDFGQTISSKKYSGKTQSVRGHCIVFSNRAPLEQLLHRDIVHIDLSTLPQEPLVDEDEISYITNYPPVKPLAQTAMPVIPVNTPLPYEPIQDIVIQPLPINPSIRRITSGALVKYITTNRIAGRTMTKSHNSLKEAEIYNDSLPKVS